VYDSVRVSISMYMLVFICVCQCIVYSVYTTLHPIPCRSSVCVSIVYVLVC
jgi:hypothetical protein